MYSMLNVFYVECLLWPEDWKRRLFLLVFYVVGIMLNVFYVKRILCGMFALA